MSNTVHSFTLGMPLAWALFSLLSFSVSKVLNTAAGVLGLWCSAFVEEVLSAACFSLPGYWILEIKMGQRCSGTILLSTEVQQSRPPRCAGTVFVDWLTKPEMDTGAVGTTQVHWNGTIPKYKTTAQQIACESQLALAIWQPGYLNCL